MLVPDRTAFDKGFTRVFHVCAYGATFYSDLVSKYGADNVFRAASATAEDVPFRSAVSMCLTGRNDQIKVYPGTYSFAAVVTVNKGCVIESATGNAGDVIIDLDTAKVAGFSVTAAGVIIRNMTITNATTGATIAVASTGDATIVENLIIVCAVAETGAAVDLDGDRSVVRNCNIGDVIAGIQVNGSYCVVDGNMIYSTSTAGVGIELTASTTGKSTACIVKNNILNLRGGTGDVGLKVVAAATHCVANENMFALGLAKDMIIPAITDCDSFRSVLSNTTAAGQVGAVVSTS